MKYFKYIFNTLLLLLAVTAGLFAAGHFELIPFPKPYVVTSGSMQPAISTGSVVLVYPKQFGYSIGDVITFKGQGKGSTTTHRIVGLEMKDGGLAYSTKGDANDVTDNAIVPVDKVVGEVIFTVPYLGEAAAAAQTPKGFIAIVIIPATLIIYEELKTLRTELAKSVKDTYAKIRGRQPAPTTSDLTLQPPPPTQGFDPVARPSSVLALVRSQETAGPELIDSSQPESKPSARTFSLNPAIGLPIVGALLVIATAASAAFFTDDEQSSSNVLGAASQYTDHLVINEILYDPSDLQGGDDNEWVELFNPTDSAINVNNWTLADNNSVETFPDVTIPSGGFAIVSPSDQATLAAEGWVIPDDVIFIQTPGPIGNGLGNDDDQLLLSDDSAVAVDGVSWGTNTTQLNPAVPDVDEGHSISRVPRGRDTDSDANFYDISAPTPGS